ncbi:unnamed protein product [Brassica napus]|uniref:(rape) hypothetical protein n=1 Tax=Brassica napus TaxID=3708 RepID=A0A816Y029_BRANA|nr:unnamed protein product [Brassica napus]
MSETPLTCPHKRNNLSINRRPYGGNGESSRAVRRRLFDGPTVPTNRAVEVEEHAEAEGETIEPQTVGRQSRVVQPSSLYTWTRFQDSLHDLLNDESSEPVLFARDAPPVIDSLEEDGTYYCTLYYNCKYDGPKWGVVAAAGRANIVTDSLVAAAYYADTWHSAYEVKIYPIPSVGENEIGGEYAGDLLPPEVRRPPGRPQKVRILSWSEEKVC